MPNYRRYYVAGGTKCTTFRDKASVGLLSHGILEMKDHWPLEACAIVVLSDYLYVIWPRPPGDADYIEDMVDDSFLKDWLNSFDFNDANPRDDLE